MINPVPNIESVLVAIPSRGGSVRAEILDAVSQWSLDSAPPAKYAGTAIRAGICKLYIARDRLVEMFLRSTASHILWIDDDMAPSYENIRKLITAAREHSALVMSAAYCARSEECLLEGEPIGDWASSEGVISMNWVGFGCVLIAREVFTRIMPLRRRLTLQDGPRTSELMSFFAAHAINPQGGHPDEDEDIAFCGRMLEAGVSLKMDLSNVVLHMGTAAFPRGSIAQQQSGYRFRVVPIT